MELQHDVHSHVCVCTSEILANGCDVASVEVVSLLVINEEVCGQSSRLNVNHPFDLLRKKNPSFILPFSLQRYYSLYNTSRLELYWCDCSVISFTYSWTISSYLIF